MCLLKYYALVEVEPKLTKFKLQKSERKNNVRTTANPHAHLQTLTKTPAKFQKDLGKIVRGVAYRKIPSVYMLW